MKYKSNDRSGNKVFTSMTRHQLCMFYVTLKSFEDVHMPLLIKIEEKMVLGIPLVKYEAAILEEGIKQAKCLSQFVEGHTELKRLHTLIVSFYYRLSSYHY